MFLEQLERLAERSRPLQTGQLPAGRGGGGHTDLCVCVCVRVRVLVRVLVRVRACTGWCRVVVAAHDTGSKGM